MTADRQEVSGQKIDGVLLQFLRRDQLLEKPKPRRLHDGRARIITTDGKRQYVNNAIKIYCKSVFDALNDADVSQIRFYDEL